MVTLPAFITASPESHAMDEIWGPAHEEDPQYLRVFIGRLRQKLGDDPSQPRSFFNEPGVGYRFLET